MKNFVTSDETMFYLDRIWTEKNVFVRNGEERNGKLTLLKHNAFAIGFLKGAGDLYRGKTENRIIDNETNIKRN